jgi:hypothetical protein
VVWSGAKEGNPGRILPGGAAAASVCLSLRPASVRPYEKKLGASHFIDSVVGALHDMELVAYNPALHLLLKTQRMAATKTEFVVFRKVA